MIVLLDTSESLATCAAELGCDVGQLLTPLTRFRLQRTELPWAIDNGAYAGFDYKAFLSLLAREEHHRDESKFLTVPDVVGSATKTLAQFRLWAPRLQGWSLAFACQDGQERVQIPWEVDAIFIGGSTKWKVSKHAVDIVKEAKDRGKWVHIGRVNNVCRYEGFAALGADSCDGTGLSRFTHMREGIGNRDNQEKLFESNPT